MKSTSIAKASLHKQGLKVSAEVFAPPLFPTVMAPFPYFYSYLQKLPSFQDPCFIHTSVYHVSSYLSPPLPTSMSDSLKKYKSETTSNSVKDRKVTQYTVHILQVKDMTMPHPATCVLLITSTKKDLVSQTLPIGLYEQHTT